MLEVFQLTQPSEHFKRNFIFRPEVTAPYSAHCLCVLDTLEDLCHKCQYGALGARLSFEIYMQGKNSKSAGRHLLTYAQKASMTRVSQCFEKLVPGCLW